MKIRDALADPVPIAIVIALLVFSVAINLQLRQDAFLPNHADEWDALAYAKELQKQQKIVFYDPTTLLPLIGNVHYYLEINYHLFLFSLLAISGISVHFLPFVLTVLLSFLLSLAVFVLVRDFTRNTLAAFIAGVFVFSLKNNVALLGYNFMVPMAFGMAMVPLLVYSFFKALHSNKYFAVFSLLTINTFLSHPVYAVLIVPAAMVFLILKPRILFENFVRMFALIAIIFGIALVLLWELFSENFSQTLVSLVVFPYDIYIPRFPLIGFVSPAEFFAIALALVGLAFFSMKKSVKLREKFFLRFRPEANFSFLLIIFSIAWILLRLYSDNTQICFLGPCRRTSTGFVVVLLLLAGVGIFFFFKFLVETILQARGLASKEMNILVAGLLAVTLTLFVWFSGGQYKADFYNVIDRAQLADVEWIKNLPERSIVFARHLEPKAVALLGEKIVPGVIGARLGNISTEEVAFDEKHNAFSPEKNPDQEIRFFFQRNCEEQKAIAKKYSITHYYLLKEPDCFLVDRVYTGGDWSVSKQLE